MKKIFISGPYTLGDVAQNVKGAMDMSNVLMDLGFAPYCPHLTHFLQINNSRAYEDWLSLDLVYLSVCDGLIRIFGESNGADKEVEFARKNSIPVFYSIRELIDYPEFKKKHKPIKTMINDPFIQISFFLLVCAFLIFASGMSFAPAAQEAWQYLKSLWKKIKEQIITDDPYDEQTNKTKVSIYREPLFFKDLDELKDKKESKVVKMDKKEVESI